LLSSLALEVQAECVTLTRAHNTERGRGCISPWSSIRRLKAVLRRVSLCCQNTFNPGAAKHDAPSWRNPARCDEQPTRGTAVAPRLHAVL